MRTPLLIFLCFAACKTPSAPPPAAQVLAAVKDTAPPDTLPPFVAFDRTEILAALQQKVATAQPLLVHVRVPLCDNLHQGIVPVNATLGDGLNLNGNLYWGARYGMRSFFAKHGSWKLLQSTPNLSADILERVVFERRYANGARVLLVADAFRGDRMEACLRAFWAGAAGVATDSLRLSESAYALADADLLVFNGHNGLMDVMVKPVPAQPVRKRDAIAIACVSGPYFREGLNACQAYPLLGTTGLMAPEAYVLGAAIDAWADLQDESAVHEAAASAYHQYQQCGIKGARRLFSTGW